MDDMSERWETQGRAVIDDLRSVFASRLESVVAYGDGLDPASRAPLTLLALVLTLTHDDLDACARLVTRWSRAGIDTPLVLPVNEFKRSVDAFPLEYADIVSNHRVVFGAEPFAHITIAPEDVRRACERQVASLLLHLREGYLQTGANPQAISRLVMASVPAFSAILRGIARLTASTGPTRSAEALAGARTMGMPDDVVSQVLALEGSSLTASDGARMFPAYLAAIEHLVDRVDRWRS